jgi:hypothetical protein
MKEDDLYALRHDSAGPAVSCRPVDAVLARGRRLRRRRQVLRSAGVGAVVVTAVGTGLFAVSRQAGTGDGDGGGGGRADVAAGSDPTAAPRSPADDTPSPPPPPPPDCSRDLISPERVPVDEVADELRLLPTWTPDGEPITVARGNRWRSSCPGAEIYPLGSALELQTDGGDGTVDAEITVNGPLPWLASELPDMMPVGETQETTLRGHEARLRGGGEAEGLTFEWTEPDGWSWELRGEGVDEATLRAVGEALALDTSPEGDEPPAALDEADVPGGFEVIWQQRGRPEPAGDQTSWSVEIGEQATDDQPVETGIRCTMEVRSDAGMPASTYGGAGSTEASVNGQPAVWAPWPGSPLGAAGTSLTWDVAPGVRATAGCVDWDTDSSQSVTRETVVRIAESVEPVAADDPRLPG